MSAPSGSGFCAANEPSKFPIAVRKEEIHSLPNLREICDSSFKGCVRDSRGQVTCGAAVTYENADADKFATVRDKAKLALEFYKKKARVNMNLELVEVRKANYLDGGYYGLTFTAVESGSDEGLVFRGVLRFKKPLFCEVKDAIKLVPSYKR